ncbi:MAG: 2-phosphosulfolactate phosphatase, partial [Actinomycetota bacterium]|nr:2-phosphosulfolactate phosphatase [Actinomycetota bacterium]
MDDQLWAQAGYAVRCEWGPVGAARVASAGGAVVVVDVLSFTTSVSVAVERGTVVYPAAWRDSRAADLAAAEEAALAVGRREVTAEHPWSLSPAALLRAPAPERLVLPSPNGSAIAAAASGAVVAACLRNAPAVARWLVASGYGTEATPVAVVPAGERWPDGTLRPALEDALGAGAVIAALADLGCVSSSPEAAALRALHSGTADVAAAVRACGSGDELRRHGFGDDVEIAVQMGVSDVVPVLDGRR